MSPRTTWTGFVCALLIAGGSFGCTSGGERAAGDLAPGARPRTAGPSAEQSTRAGSPSIEGSASEAGEDAKPVHASEPPDPQQAGPRSVAVVPQDPLGGQSGAEGMCQPPCPGDPPWGTAFTTSELLDVTLGAHVVSLTWHDPVFARDGGAVRESLPLMLDVTAVGEPVHMPDDGFVPECGSLPLQQPVDLRLRSVDPELDVTFPALVELIGDADVPARTYVQFVDHSLFPPGFAPESLGHRHDADPFFLALTFRPGSVAGELYTSGRAANCPVATLGEVWCKYGGRPYAFDEPVGALHRTDLIEALQALEPQPGQWSDGSSSALALREIVEPEVPQCVRGLRCATRILLLQLSVRITTADGRVDVWLPVEAETYVRPDDAWEHEHSLWGDVLGTVAALTADGGRLDLGFAPEDVVRVELRIRRRDQPTSQFDAGKLMISRVTPDPGAVVPAEPFVATEACLGADELAASFTWGDQELLP